MRERESVDLELAEDLDRVGCLAALGCHNRLMDTRGDIVRLAHRGLGVSEFSLAAARALRRAVPFDGVCGLPEEAQPRYAEIEVAEEDFNRFTDLAHAPLIADQYGSRSASGR